MYFRSAVFIWYYRLSALFHCTSIVPVWQSLECFGHRIEQFPAHLWSIHRHLSAPLTSLSPPLTECDGCLEDCIGAHGWVVGIASHGSVTCILSGGRLVTVEAPGLFL